MDYYSNRGGEWSNFYHKKQERERKRKEREKRKKKEIKFES